jgi:hypothetical protein
VTPCCLEDLDLPWDEERLQQLNSRKADPTEIENDQWGRAMCLWSVRGPALENVESEPALLEPDTWFCR